MYLSYVGHLLTYNFFQDPWNESNDDASYGETLNLMTRAAEAHWYAGDLDEAKTQLLEIDRHVHDPKDRAPAAIIGSRVYAQRGDSRTAFLTLQRAMSGFEVEINDMTYDECDKEFERLVPLIQSKELDLGEESIQQADRSMHTLGALVRIPMGRTLCHCLEK